MTRDMVDVLRPATPGAIQPYDIGLVLGTRALKDIPKGKDLRWTQFGE